MTAAATDRRPRLYLHIGTRKSGTSYLQAMLERSRAALAEQGLHLALTTTDGFEEIVPPLKRHGLGGTDPGEAERAVDRLVATLDPAFPRQLVSIEGLAELRRPTVDLLLDALTAYDVELVLTVRPWDRVIPSEWQQCVKERATEPFDDYLAAIRAGGPSAELFLLRQDAPAIVGRWTHRLEAARVHVVAVPAARDGATIEELFCAVVGVDPGRLRRPQAGVNESLTFVQAEVLRRVNLALGERLTGPEEYRRAVRGWLVKQCLMRLPSGGAPIRIPPEHAAWCAEAMRSQLDGLLSLGVDLVGEPADLVPEVRVGEVRAEEPQVAAEAVELIAGLTALRWSERFKHRRVVAELTEQRDALAAELARARAEPAGRRPLVRRLTGRLRGSGRVGS